MQIIIEGTIGAGKSTAMKTLEQQFPDAFDCYYEPIKQWTEDTTMLTDLYKDPKNHAFNFEVGSLLQFSKPSCLDINDWPDITSIQERSIFAAYYVFSTCQYEMGNITDLQYNLLGQLFERCVQSSRANGIFYLQMNTEQAYERIKQRGRLAEQDINYSYLDRICALYDNVFIEQANQFAIPVKVIDATLTSSQIAQELRQFCQVVEERQSVQNYPPSLVKKSTQLIKWESY